MSIEITNTLAKEINERVFYYFREISKIPRGSGNEQAISDYLVAFAKERNLTFKRCDVPVGDRLTLNVVICKDATKGYEALETVVLQGHTDMVCQKTKESTHNFETDPIEIIEKDGMMTANCTTLGADDGIGVACILAILESDKIAHPKIEALCTSDEEDGMTGAIAVTGELVTGRRLINIDTESEGTLYYGCAGGVNANFCLPIKHEPIPSNYSLLQVEISGLLGGHSGVEIHKKRANAHKLMARTLRTIQDAYPLCLVTFTGGDKRNVITRNVSVVIGVEAANVDSVISLVSKQKDTFVKEYDGIETSIELTAVRAESAQTQALSQESMNALITLIYIIPNDIQAMHGKVEGLVETSCNLGIVRQEDEQIVLCSLIRSFVRTKKLFVLDQMRQLAKLFGAAFDGSSDYPDWNPNTNSELIARFRSAYLSTFSKEPRLESIHAGLECGYFAEKFPTMDIIACGPTITGAHTPEEKLDIDSTEKVVELLLNVLSQMDSPISNMVCTCSEMDTAVQNDEQICQCIR